MRMNNLIQYIVPLTFLAIWALTSLFNREAQPLPPRTARTPGPGGPRPALTSQAARTPAARQPISPNPDNGPRRVEPDRRPPQRTGRSANDDIVIIDSDQRRPSSPAPRLNPTPVRKPNRGRANVAATPRRPEPPTPRTLAASMTSQNTIASEVAQPKHLDPLRLPPSPLMSLDTSEIPKAFSITERNADGDHFSALDFRTLVANQTRLREAFIMNEILQPPVALRGYASRRR